MSKYQSADEAINWWPIDNSTQGRFVSEKRRLASGWLIDAGGTGDFLVRQLPDKDVLLFRALNKLNNSGKEESERTYSYASSCSSATAHTLIRYSKRFVECRCGKLFGRISHAK